MSRTIAALAANAVQCRASRLSTLDQQKKVQIFGVNSTAGGVLLRLLVHNHEHMGQAVAYARMNGIAPPWS